MNVITEMKKDTASLLVKYVLITIALSFSPSIVKASEIQSCIYGKITDGNTGQALPSVYVIIPGTSNGTITDMEGNYRLPLRKGKYVVKVSYMLYESKEITVEIEENEVLHVDVKLSPNVEMLSAVTVRAARAASSEEFVLVEIKEAQNVVSGISAQQISKTQDNNASEVVKRIPGVTLIDGRFVAVRGLSQRYNNTWINQGVTPGSESDSRAFSFDMIPSSMIDRIMVYKNLSPELPADFSGGFVKITTRGIPEKNQLLLSYGTGFRANSVFRAVSGYSLSAMDLLGAGSASRNLPSPFPSHLNEVSLQESCAEAQKLNNRWALKKSTAIPDQNLSFSLNHVKKLARLSVGQSAYISYGYLNDMLNIINNNYGIYHVEKQESSYNKEYTDTQYLTEVKTVAGYNLSLLDNKANKVSFKNLVQNIGKDLVTLREGMNYSNDYQERSREYLYRNRLTYVSQLEGSHGIKKDTNSVCWTVGYAFTRNNEPDRRIMESRMDKNEGSPYYGKYKSMDNDIRRYFQRLNEHSVSAALNYQHRFFIHHFEPSIKTGIYSEYRHRNFAARNFAYQKGIDHTLSPDYFYLPYEEMMSPEYIRPDGFFLTENTGKSDSYQSSNLIDAAYLTLNLPFFGITLNGGVRFEHQYLTLDSYESDGIRPVTIRQHHFNLFPAANLSYSLRDKHVFRVVYGKTVNRPEIREIAPYVYYDFESFAYFEGNPGLQNASIHNLDFRYEFYPASSEMITFGGFYKKFINPIENTYYYTGGQLQYTYMNAHSAYSCGIEVDIRKSLDFIGIKGLTLIINAALIKSEVIFPEESREAKRPMQGQSPYIVNAGLYYHHKKLDLSFSILYNVAGKRIVTVGQSNQNANENIPHTYEMPRHSLDATIQKGFGRVTLRLGAKNILCQKTILSQLGTYTTEGGEHSYRQDTRIIRTGVQINASVSVKLN